MSKYDELHNVIKKRESFEINDDFAIEDHRALMIDIFCKDIDFTNRFLEEECTESEYSWLSEIFEDIAEKTHNKIFIENLWKLSEKYPEETKKYNVISFIKSAEEIVADN
ncbi:MAG: hypothetical protein K6G88_06650 [Lachnospiraceae bacterium]|nr:hypothetical protein [Lachnospiraceae bacterium]